MNTQSAGQHWFVLLNGKRHGPFPFAALTKAAKQGVITAETNVWRRGWQKWHPARQVPGLLNEAPLAPDDAEWTDERLGSPTEEALLYAPRRSGGARPAPDVVTLRPPPSEHPTEHIFADEWRMLAERPAQDRGKIAPASRFGRKTSAPKSADLDVTPRDLAVYRQVASAEKTPARSRRSYQRAVAGLLAILLLCAAGWFRLGGGLLRQSTDTQPIKASYTPASSAVMASPDSLPATVASLPAVAALQRNDPAAFERFKRRYAESAQNAHDDEVQSLARAALRKSVKHLLAIASGDVLLEITETSLAYMQGLQASNPESCVALSDESKGAKLTSNLAKELPVQFARDMSVLERIASTNPHTGVAPMAAEEARPSLETVFNALRTQSVKSELLGRPKLEPADFAPYCALVIAFYKAVLDLPRDEKVNLLRYLYAAAAKADIDLANK
jgi:GYF domain 2